MSIYSFFCGWQDANTGWIPPPTSSLISEASTIGKIPGFVKALKIARFSFAFHSKNLLGHEYNFRSHLSFFNLAFCQNAQLKNSFVLIARAWSRSRRESYYVHTNLLLCVTFGLFCVPRSSKLRVVRPLHFFRDHLSIISSLTALVAAAILWKSGDHSHALGIVVSLTYSASLVALERYSIISARTAAMSYKVLSHFFIFVAPLHSITANSARLSKIFVIVRCIFQSMRLEFSQFVMNSDQIQKLFAHYFLDELVQNLGLEISPTEQFITFNGITNAYFNVIVRPNPPASLIDKDYPLSEEEIRKVVMYYAFRQHCYDQLRPLSYIKEQLHGSLEERQKMIGNGIFGLNLKEAISKFEAITSTDLLNWGWLSHKSEREKNRELILNICRAMREQQV